MNLKKPVLEIRNPQFRLNPLNSTPHDTTHIELQTNFVYYSYFVGTCSTSTTWKTVGVKCNSTWQLVYSGIKFPRTLMSTVLRVSNIAGNDSGLGGENVVSGRTRRLLTHGSQNGDCGHYKMASTISR